MPRWHGLLWNSNSVYSRPMDDASRTRSAYDGARRLRLTGRVAAHPGGARRSSRIRLRLERRAPPAEREADDRRRGHGRVDRLPHDGPSERREAVPDAHDLDGGREVGDLPRGPRGQRAAGVPGERADRRHRPAHRRHDRHGQPQPVAQAQRPLLRARPARGPAAAGRAAPRPAARGRARRRAEGRVQLRARRDHAADRRARRRRVRARRRRDAALLGRQPRSRSAARPAPVAPARRRPPRDRRPQHGPEAGPRGVAPPLRGGGEGPRRHPQHRPRDGGGPHGRRRAAPDGPRAGEPVGARRDRLLPRDDGRRAAADVDRARRRHRQPAALRRAGRRVGDARDVRDRGRGDVQPDGPPAVAARAPDRPGRREPAHEPHDDPGPDRRGHGRRPHGRPLARQRHRGTDAWPSSTASRATST